MVDYRGKKVVIVGLGLTGLSCVDFFLSRGVVPKVIDTRAQPNGLDKLAKQVPCHVGGLNLDWLLEADLIVSSPGIALNTPELQQAVEAGVEVIGDIELFCREADQPIIAITGSNGKTTVTTLVGEIAKQSGLRVGVGGNIGIPALDLLQQDCQLYVLELSSFQLETTSSLKASAAAVLNLSEDHMDRYPLGISQYQAAKLRIYHQAACCISNADDPLTWPHELAQGIAKTVGVAQGDYHLLSQDYETWLAKDQQPLLNCADLKLVGQHNYTNALFALALADAVNIPRQVSLNTLKNFSGLPHRCQKVWVNKGVVWLNDSKATNVGSTEAALKGLKLSGTLHLLLGGDGKSADFSPLRDYLQHEHIRIYCFGRDGAQLQRLRPEIAELTETMEQAMQIIAQRVVDGDVVLLSPACASLDQFRNYEQRGDLFARLAQELG